MANFSKLIEKKADAAQYMVDEITHICKDMPKRTPGEEGERIACEYMADVLKKDCGCERSDVESFKENPGSFFGWIYITITCVLAGLIAYFFLPILGFALIVFGFYVMIMQFGLYKKTFDFLFPEKTGTNVTAIKKCTGEVKGRVFFNGHPDAAWNWPVNNKFGGKVYEANIVIVVLGALFLMGCNLAAAILTGFKPMILKPENGVLFWLGIANIAFVPFYFGMYRMWDPNTTVDGANDNLTGVFVAVSALKCLKESGIRYENTEVCALLTGSEEAGLRGATAFTKRHKGENKDVETYIIAFDTMRDYDYMTIYHRDMTGMVKNSPEVVALLDEACNDPDVNHPLPHGVVPFGASDAAAFSRGGFKAAAVAGQNPKYAPYYHNRRDTPDQMIPETFALGLDIALAAIEAFDRDQK